MPIDPSIAMGVRPIKIADPLEQYGQMMQIQQAQNQNRLADLMFSEKQREASESNALSELYKGAVGADGKIDRAKLYTSAAQGGLGAKLPGLQKTFADADKTEAEVSAKQIETASKRLEIAGKAFGYVRSNPTVDSVHSMADYLVQNGVWTADAAARMKADAAANPGKIPAMADQAFRGALSAKDQLAQFQTRNTGGSTDTISIDPVTSQSKVVNSVRNTQSPDSVASVAATMRGQNMTDARMREANGIASAGNVVKTETDLRKEFADLPEVKKYKSAFQAYSAVKDASGRAGPQADINLIYGIAKLYDPESVVREGEYATIANSQAIPEKIKSLAQQLQGGGKLTPATKQQLMTEAQGRLNSYEGEYGKARNGYADIASKRGADIGGVFTDAGNFKTVRVGDKSLTARQAPDGKFYVEKEGKFYEVR